jgi:hypothetical protein
MGRGEFNDKFHVIIAYTPPEMVSTVHTWG